MKKILPVVLAVILFGCSKLDKKYSTETYLADIQEIRKEDTTASSLIWKEIRDKAKEEQDKKEEIERIEMIEMMKKIVNVSITDKKLIKQDYSEDMAYNMIFENLSDKDYSEDMAYNMIFENLSDKDIIAFKGTVVITDIFGLEIKSLRIKYDKTITAKGKYEGGNIYDWNQFSNVDKILNSKEIKDLKFVWKPENITFSDGTTFGGFGGC